MDKKGGAKMVPTVFVLLLLLGAFFVAATSVVVADQEDYYTYSVSGGFATITDYTDPYGGAITIPSTLGGYAVVAIGDSAFSTTPLTSVIIPDSVLSIGNWAFSQTPLTSVSMPDSIISIGDSAFGYCVSLLSITIPGSVISIGNTPFQECTSLTAIDVSASNPVFASNDGVLYDKTMTTLIECPCAKTSVVIPSSVMSIGAKALVSCNLTSVTIPDGVTSIGFQAFYNCRIMTSVTIPGSVTNIGVSAFESCVALTSITISDGVMTIEESAFNYCLALTNITIPGSVISIGPYAFAISVSLTSITFLGLVAPTAVDSTWLYSGNAGVRGHAFTASNFPAPGGVWNGLTMGNVIEVTTVPGVPVNFHATSGNAQVILTWQAPAGNGGSPITGYKVYRGTTSGGETWLATVGGVLTYTDSGLTNGKTYYYEITAVNSVGEGPQSNEASATPADVPSAPQALLIFPGDGKVTLVWNAPSNPGGSSITNYRVYRGTTLGGETPLTTLGKVLGYTDTDLANGQTYYYKVTAINSAGEGNLTESVMTTPTASNPDGGGDMTLVIAIVAMFAVAALLVVLLFYTRKKKKKM